MLLLHEGKTSLASTPFIISPPKRCMGFDRKEFSSEMVSVKEKTICYAGSV
jgi:hypothetical protein